MRATIIRLLVIVSLITVGIVSNLRMPINRSGNHSLVNSKQQQSNLPQEAEADKQADGAAEYFLKKRLPSGESDIPIERYLDAIEQKKRLPTYSTATNELVFLNESQKMVAAQNVGLSTWVPLGPGNIGGRTRALLIHPRTPDIMYAAGVSGGIWKTTNAGASWIPLNDFLPALTICSMAMDLSDPEIIYAGTGEAYTGFAGAGIYKTTNGGATWSQLTNTLNLNFAYVNDIVISSNDPQRVYAATLNGVFASKDGGTTWTQQLDRRCYDLVIRTDQPTDYLVASCGPTPTALYLNEDAGGAGRWNVVLSENEMGRTMLAVAPSNQNVIYALAASASPGFYYQGLHAVFRSTDGGKSWQARVRNTDSVKLNTKLLSSTTCSDEGNYNSGAYDNIIAVDPLDPDRVWTGGIRLYRSDDGGANWKSADASLHPDLHALVFHPNYNGTTNTILFSGNDGGVYKTSNARAALNPPCKESPIEWTALNNNYGVTQFYFGLPYPDGTSYLGGTQDNGTVLGENSLGRDGWQQVLGGDGGYVAINPTNTDVMYAEQQYGAIQKSTNEGKTFRVAMDGFTDAASFFIRPFVMDPINPNVLWACGSYIWRTNDGATHWEQANTNSPQDIGAIVSLAIAPTNDNYVLAGTSNGPILRTTSALSATANTLWVNTTPRQGYCSSLTFDPSNQMIAYATYSSFHPYTNDSHVYKSTDAGATWVGIDGSGENKLPDIPVHSLVIDPANPARIYVATDIGVFVTLDGGGGWAQENTGFANVITESLAVNTANGIVRLFAFTHGRGAWQVRLAAFVSKISAVSVSGKKLIVTGTYFDDGATILINGEQQKTQVKGDSPITTLIAKKSGKKIRPGDMVQVLNGDSSLSNTFIYDGGQ